MSQNTRLHKNGVGKVIATVDGVRRQFANATAPSTSSSMRLRAVVADVAFRSYSDRIVYPDGY